MIWLALVWFVGYVCGARAGFKSGARSREIELRVLKHQGHDINEFLERLP